MSKQAGSGWRAGGGCMEAASSARAAPRRGSTCQDRVCEMVALTGLAAVNAWMRVTARVHTSVAGPLRRRRTP